METKELIEKECIASNAISSGEKAIVRIFRKKKTVMIGILILAILLSFFVAPFAVDKLHITDEANKILDNKKDTVVAVTATAATISVAIAAIPGDSTTPLANQIAELDIFFIIVLIAIYLLKILLAVSISLSFRIIFPSACLLLIINILTKGEYFKKIAIKILALGLVIFLTVPISVGTMDIVDTTLKTQEKIETIAVEVIPEESVEEESEDKNWWSKFWDDVSDKVKYAADNVANATKEMYQKAKDKFSELVDVVASMIITCCIIPLLVMVFLAWVLKILFGIKISTKNIYGKLHDKMKKINNTNGEEDEEIDSSESVK